MKKIFILPALCILLSSIGNPARAQYSCDSVTFETPVTTIIIDSATNNLWQIGQPDKEFFDSSYGGMNAILSDKE